MATSVAELAINITTNIASLQTGMNRAVEIASSTANRIDRAFSGVQKTLAGLGVGITFAGLVAGIKSVIDYADKLNDLSQQTGIAVETLGGLGYAARQSGVDLDTVAKGVQKLAQNMADAAGGNTQLQSLFDKVGVSIKSLDGSLRPLDETLFAIADKFASYKDGPEKAALANELFKKGGERLIPLLNQGGDALRAMVEEWKKYAGVTDDTAKRADLFNDSLDRIKLIAGSLFSTIASALLPTMQAIVDVFLNAKSSGDGFSVVATGMTGVLKGLAVVGITVFESFKAIGGSINTLIQAAIALSSGSGFSTAWKIIKEGFADVGSSISGSIDNARKIWNASAADMAASTLRDSNKIAAPFKQTAKAADDLKLSIEKLLKPFNDLIASLGKTGAELDAQLASLRQYGVETKATAVATAEYELTQGKLADRLTAISFLYPQLAEAIRFVTLSQAQHNDATQTAIELERQYIDAVRQHVEALANSVSSIEREISVEFERADAIGRTREELVNLRIAQEESALASLRVMEGADLEVRAAELRIDALRRLRGAVVGTDTIQRQVQDMQALFSTFDSIGRDIFDSLADKGANMWQKIKESGKRILLDFLYSLTLRPFLITIAATLTGVPQQAAANVLGTGGNPANPLSFLTGGGSSLFQSAGNLFFGAGSAGAAAMGAGFSAGIETLKIAATAGVDAIGGVSSALGAFGAVAGPLIPLFALAVPLLGGLFDKKPSEVRGRFQVSAGTTGFEDSVFTASRLGNLGFADTDTAQFSGQAAQVFNKIVGGAIDAFDARFSQEQSDRLAQVLQSTDFGSFEGTFTTQDFIQQYGGQVLQQVVVAAFDVLDPALAKVASGFDGTADEIAGFANTLLAVYDASKGLSDAVRANVIGALDSTQETATKVLAFVNVLSTFGDALTGLRPALEGLDPSKISDFVDALGGAQAFFDSFAYLNANFLTTAERTAQATAQLTAAMDALGVAVPETHRAFLDLINAAIAAGNTDLAASLQKLAPLFVQVKGTADQAAGALGNLGDAAQGAANMVTKAVAQIQNIDPFTGLKESQEFLSKIANLTDQSTGDFGEKLSLQIGLITSEIDRLVAYRPETFNGSFATDLTHAVDQEIAELRGASTDFANQLARFTVLSAQYDAERAAQLVQLEQWYAEQRKIFGGAQIDQQIASLERQRDRYQQIIDQINAGFITASPGAIDQSRAQIATLNEQIENLAASGSPALQALHTIFQQRWDAIVNGVSDGVNGTLDQLTRLKEGIADYLRSLSIGDLSVLTPQQQLDQAQASYVDTLMKAQAGDLGALGDLTKFADDYLKEAREFYKTSDPYVAIYDAVTSQLGEIAGTTPTGLPLPQSDNAALASVLPSSGRLASSDDIKALGDRLDSVVAALADANTADSKDEQAALAAAAREIAAAGASQLK